MAVPIEEIFPAEDFTNDAKDRVIEYLARLQRPAPERRHLYARWARAVGIPAESEDLDRVAVLRNGPATIPGFGLR